MHNDKLKIAQMIASFLGVENKDSKFMSPETLINSALSSLKDKNNGPLSGDQARTLIDMLKQATQAGINVPTNVKNLTEETLVKKKRGRPTMLSKIKTRKTPRGVKPVAKPPVEKQTSSDSDKSKLGRPEGSTNEPGDDHIIMQLRSAQDLGGNKPIKFRSGGDQKVHPQHIDKILKLHDRLENPKQKRLLRVLVSKSHEHLKDIASQIKESVFVEDDHNILEQYYDDIYDDDSDAIVNTIDFPCDEDEIVNSIDSEDDILHLYDPEELAIVDADTGIIVDEDEEGDGLEDDLKEPHLNEVMTRAARIKARMRFLRTKTKRMRRLQIALHRRSDDKTINRRARRLAIQQIKMRLTRKPVDQLTIPEKERVEKILQKRKDLIDRLTRRLAPQIRKIEMQRMSHPHITQQ